MDDQGHVARKQAYCALECGEATVILFKGKLRFANTDMVCDDFLVTFQEFREDSVSVTMPACALVGDRTAVFLDVVLLFVVARFEIRNGTFCRVEALGLHPRASDAVIYGIVARPAGVVACPVPRFRDTLRGDRMRAQELGDPHIEISRGLPGHNLEERGHAMWVEARITHRPNPDAIRFIFVAAGEIDLLLCRRSLGNHHASLRSISVAGNDACQNCAQHYCRGHYALALTGMDGTRDMTLRNVRDLVCQNAGKFVFIAGGLEQAGVHTDETAGEGKCIDIRVVDDEELEALGAVVDVGNDAATDFIDVLGNDRVFDDRSALSDLSHDCASEARFIRLGQHGICRASHVRQLDIVGASAAGHYEQRGR